MQVSSHICLKNQESAAKRKPPTVRKTLFEDSENNNENTDSNIEDAQEAIEREQNILGCNECHYLQDKIKQLELQNLNLQDDNKKLKEDIQNV